MMCVDCGKLRHEGPCEDRPDREPDALEMLEMDADRALERYEQALREKNNERIG